MITKFAHIGAEVQNGQFAYVIIPGQDPIPTIVMGTHDSMVLVQGDAQTSWVDSEFIYERNGEWSGGRGPPVDNLWITLLSFRYLKQLKQFDSGPVFWYNKHIR